MNYATITLDGGRTLLDEEGLSGFLLSKDIVWLPPMSPGDMIEYNWGYIFRLSDSSKDQCSCCSSVNVPTESYPDDGDVLCELCANSMAGTNFKNDWSMSILDLAKQQAFATNLIIKELRHGRLYRRVKAGNPDPQSNQP